MADPRFAIPDEVQSAYSKLRDRSQGARYLMRQFTAADVQRAIDVYLAKVTEFVTL